MCGISCFSFPFCFSFAAVDWWSLRTEDEEAIRLSFGEGLERRVDGGVERMFRMGFLGVGVFGVEVRSGGGEGVVGCWKIGLLVKSMLFQSRYGCAGKEGLGSCIHHSLSILSLSSAAVGNIAKIFHAFLFDITPSRGERLSKSHRGLVLFNKN